MKNTLLGLLTAWMILGVVATPLSSVHAASLESISDTVTRLAVSTTADHSIVFTQPTGIDFDLTGNTDEITITFPSGFTFGGTWVAGDFTFNDGSARTINSTVATNGTPDCTGASGTDTVAVAIDATAKTFTIAPCATYTAGSTAATITFTIDGTTADGTLTHPSSATSQAVTISMDDEGTTGAHSGSFALGIADSDQVTVTATVDPSLTFDLDTATTDTDSNASYSVALGTITTTDSRVSGATDSVNYIWVDLDTNASGGAVVTVRNANGANGMVSTSSGTDNISSSDGAIADGTERYGLCVVSVTESSGTGLEKASPYDTGTCAGDSETNDVQALTTTGENILNTTSDPVAGGRAQIAVNASISGTTEAHDDYTDTLTFIATGTF